MHVYEYGCKAALALKPSLFNSGYVKLSEAAMTTLVNTVKI